MSAVKPLPAIQPDAAINPGSKIRAAVRAAMAREFPAGLRALVLTGSLARDEGTWLHDERGVRLAGDAEFLAIFEDRVALPPPARVATLNRVIENRLCAERIQARIGVVPVGLAYLRGLRPHIFAYELRAHGQVLDGDPRVLELVPRFPAAAIPLEDGFWLLLNRMIELLEALSTAAPEPGVRLAERVRHCAAKLWLDMATSFLLFQGEYESTYRARRAKLAAALAAVTASPIDAARFQDRTAVATRWKLRDGRGGSPVTIAEPTVTVDDLVAQVADVRALWRWELARLGAAFDAEVADHVLMERWVAAQPVAVRLRGWASVVKRHGLRASLKRLPRWAARSTSGSPRYLIYAAASELFFALPALLGPNPLVAPAALLERVRRRLPRGDELEGDPSWRGAARAIASNYHQFLEDTRS